VNEEEEEEDIYLTEKHNNHDKSNISCQKTIR